MLVGRLLPPSSSERFSQRLGCTPLQPVLCPRHSCRHALPQHYQTIHRQRQYHRLSVTRVLAATEDHGFEMGMSPQLRSAVDKMVAEHKIVLFMKGTPQFPQCGFSNTCIQILNAMGAPYETVNILESELLRQGMKEYSQWPTFPQVYIDGEFYGGCDIMIESYTNATFSRGAHCRNPGSQKLTVWWRADMRIGAASTAILNVALLSFFIFQGLQSPFRKLGGSNYPAAAKAAGHDPISGDISELTAFDPDMLTGADLTALDEAEMEPTLTTSIDTADQVQEIEEAEAEAEREAGELPEEEEEAAPNPEDDIIPIAEDHFEVGSATDASYYLKYIKHDFRPWRKYGIPRELIDEASRRYLECTGEVLRFQIVKGVLWVDHLSERHDGWYPSKFGPGVLSGKGKIPYAILAVMDTLRHYPGQIPDCDAIIQTSDFPCFLRSPTNPKPNEVPPPPIFGYNSDINHSDIPFPDYTYWGHEYQHLTGSNKKSIHGWEQQWKFLANKWKTTPLAKRIGQIMWRGRTNDPEFPERDWLRRKFAACPETLTKMGRAEDAAVFNLVEPKLGLHDTCDYRYPMHIESHAWTTNTKQKMACGSVFVSHKLEYYEWFTRALKPGVHFVEVDPETICVDTATKIKHMNAQFELYAKDIPPPGFSEDDHPGGALHDYPGSQRAAGTTKAADATGSDVSAAQAALAEPGALSTEAHQQTAVTGSGTRQPTVTDTGATAAATDPVLKPGRQDPTAGSASHQENPNARGAATERRQLLQNSLPQSMKTSEVEKEASLDKPWLIAEASYAFVRDHIRMDDVRLYIRDALKEYASLQSGDVQPTWNADCYTGELLLEQFGFPHKTDRDIVTQAYPWLKEYNQEACKGKLSRKKYYAQLEAVKSGS
ncbi:hypothetical protein WJX84_004391 [Apatococcus fuscideae]|uniref:Glycosyl transferase CAP10 domain-containing protein n=1 Tax=Apatococcus fuscideae TaxID=2026836 RepID=A0AAW1SUM3_9CHLO